MHASGAVVALTLTVTNVSRNAIAYQTVPPDNGTNTFLAVRAGQPTYPCAGGTGGETQGTYEFDPKIPVAFTCGWAPMYLPGGSQNQAPGVYQIQALLGPGTLNGVAYSQPNCGRILSR